MDADGERKARGVKKRWRIIADGVRVSACMNPCSNDSQNPGYCAAWQGIGRVGLFQPEKRNSKGQSASIHWAQILWKNLTRPLRVWFRFFPKSFRSSILPHLGPFHFAFRVQSAVGIICVWVALRTETAMAVEWIAGRLQMGSPGYFKHLLYRSRKQDPKRGTI